MRNIHLHPSVFDQLFQSVGFGEVSTFRIEAPFRVPSVDDYIAFLRTAAAPVMAMLSRLAPPVQEAAWSDIRAQLAMFQEPDGWTGPNMLLLATGRK